MKPPQEKSLYTTILLDNHKSHDWKQNQKTTQDSWKYKFEGQAVNDYLHTGLRLGCVAKRPRIWLQCIARLPTKHPLRYAVAKCRFMDILPYPSSDVATISKLIGVKETFLACHPDRGHLSRPRNCPGRNNRYR